MPTFVGLHGKSVSFTPGTITTNELPGTPVEPASLFEAQLAFRLSPDQDEDGLMDEWEMTYFGDLTTTAGLDHEDQDGDRFIDRHEHEAGTVPTNGASLLVLDAIQSSMVQETNSVILSWQAVPGRVYAISGRTDSDPAWQTVATGIVATNISGTYNLQAVDSTMFFRVELE
jgi:hypothetical protein